MLMLHRWSAFDFKLSNDARRDHHTAPQLACGPLKLAESAACWIVRSGREDAYCLRRVLRSAIHAFSHVSRRQLHC
jgi:hypothetical protein